MPADNGSSSALGFPRQEVLNRPNGVYSPTPLPKRPKGRWFIGFILVVIAGAAAYSVWTSYFRYQAYGSITGNLIQISPTWEGDLSFLQVREGDWVRQGQVLFAVENTELKQRYAQLGDELRVAQAQLGAEAARLKWQSAFGIDQSRGSMGTYYQAWGILLKEQARLGDLRCEVRRSELLWQSKAISREELERYQFAAKGQQDLVDKLSLELNELKQRAAQADSLLKKDAKWNLGLEQTGYDQLKPFISKIEALQAESGRVQDRLNQGQVHAQVNGLVVKVHHYTGERCKVGEPVVVLLQEASLQVVLYMPQDASTLLHPEQEVRLDLDPYRDPLACRVKRLGDQYEPAPEHLKRYYREGQRLLLVHLQPSDEAQRWMALRIGGVVKLPYQGANVLGGRP
jgi:multidrug resistance efflux pump